MIDLPPVGYDYVVIWRSVADGPVASAAMEGYYWITRNAKGEMVETWAPMPKLAEPKR